MGRVRRARSCVAPAVVRPGGHQRRLVGAPDGRVGVVGDIPTRMIGVSAASGLYRSFRARSSSFIEAWLSH